MDDEKKAGLVIAVVVVVFAVFSTLAFVGLLKAFERGANEIRKQFEADKAKCEKEGGIATKDWVGQFNGCVYPPTNTN